MNLGAKFGEDRALAKSIKSVNLDDENIAFVERRAKEERRSFSLMLDIVIEMARKRTPEEHKRTRVNGQRSD